MKSCITQSFLIGTLILGSDLAVSARHSASRQPAYEAPAPQPQQQQDPFASFERSFNQPAQQSTQIGHGGYQQQPVQQHQNQHQAAAQSPVWQPEPAKPTKKDDGADQDDENDPEWYKAHSTSYPCYKLAEQGLFNFEQMRNMEGDWEVTDTRGRQISFNFCTYAEATSAGCEKDAFAFMRVGGKCQALTSDEPKAELNEFVTRPSQSKAGEDQDGIRLTRAGGAVCAEDTSQLMGVTIDVWCNPDVIGAPSQIQSEPKGPLDDDDADPCNVYISMEHADGCVVFDLHPFLVCLGSLMMISGICLQWMGPQAQQKFMIFIVRLGTFLIICSFAYERNYFAFVDPSEAPEKKDPAKFILAILFAFVAQWIVGWLFRYSIRLAPTLLGVYVGYYFSIYIIVAINGLGGVFETAKATHDTIDPIMSLVYEVFGAFIGGVLGYCYSAAFIALVQTFLSAYLIVRGSTMFKNLGFPNELVLMSSTSTENNGLVKLPPAFYVYSLVIVILWFIFLRSHLRRRNSGAEDRKYLDEEV